MKKLKKPIFREEIQQAHEQISVALPWPESVFSDQLDWISKNKRAWDRFLKHVNANFNSNDVWDQILSDSKDWFTEQGIDPNDPNIPRSKKTLKELLEDLAANTGFGAQPPTDTPTDTTKGSNKRSGGNMAPQKEPKQKEANH